MDEANKYYTMKSAIDNLIKLAEICELSIEEFEWYLKQAFIEYNSELVDE